METITKKKIASKMKYPNPLYRENKALHHENVKTSKAIENADMIDEFHKKYETSMEANIERGGGWQPGLRQYFDMALSRGDKMAVKALLPSIPQEYATRFKNHISQLLSKK